ncbi:alanine racemase [Curvivirga sp.]|uniref:alanine racemase n=1 Tax=Curvivirga sp. TaxID=2856848 RepID=UPI003B5CE205
MAANTSYAPSRLTIDLNAIQDNYKTICNYVTPSRSGAVVKADGYGLGEVIVSKALYDAGCRAFFTAHIDEAIAVKQAIPDASVSVMNGLLAGEETVYKEYNLVPTLNSLDQVKIWQKFCQENDSLPQANLQFDTGMARLGLMPKELNELCDDLSQLDGINLQFIMSHMACADEPSHPLNRKQQQDFVKGIARLPKATAMLAASSAIFLGEDWHFDMVRPGVALYGGRPNEDAPNPMKQVIKLEGKVVQMREVNAPETVGYAASYEAKDRRLIATVAAGYADGYIRSLSNTATAYKNEKAVPLVGRVSMDVLTFDVTHLENTADAVKTGDMLDLIGPNHDINDLAKEAGTIPYEILTSLGKRYARHYIGGE